MSYYQNLKGGLWFLKMSSCSGLMGFSLVTSACEFGGPAQHPGFLGIPCPWSWPRVVSILVPHPGPRLRADAAGTDGAAHESACALLLTAPGSLPAAELRPLLPQLATPRGLPLPALPILDNKVHLWICSLGGALDLHLQASWHLLRWKSLEKTARIHGHTVPAGARQGTEILVRFPAALTLGHPGKGLRWLLLLNLLAFCNHTTSWAHGFATHRGRRGWPSRALLLPAAERNHCPPSWRCLPLSWISRDGPHLVQGSPVFVSGSRSLFAGTSLPGWLPFPPAWSLSPFLQDPLWQ